LTGTSKCASANQWYGFEDEIQSIPAEQPPDDETYQTEHSDHTDNKSCPSHFSFLSILYHYDDNRSTDNLLSVPILKTRFHRPHNTLGDIVNVSIVIRHTDYLKVRTK